MKKSIIEGAYSMLTGVAVENPDEIIAALKAEVDSYADAKIARADARAAILAVVVPKVQSVLEGAANPMTCKEIFEAVDDWEIENWTSRSISYLMIHELADKVTKVKGDKGNTYTWNA